MSSWNHAAVESIVTLDSGKLGFKPKSIKLVDVIGDKTTALPMTGSIKIKLPKRDFLAIIVE